MNPVRIKYDNVIEHAIDIILPQVREIADGKINDRWVALKLLEEDATLLTSLNRHLGFNIMENTRLKQLVGTALKYLANNGIDPDRLRDKIVSGLIHTAEDICSNTVIHGSSKYNDADRKIDRVVTSRLFEVPIMLGLLDWFMADNRANYLTTLAWLLFRVEPLTVF